MDPVEKKCKKNANIFILTFKFFWCNQYRIILCKSQGSEKSKPAEKKNAKFSDLGGF